mgnify:CR=1 FL=1
MSAENLRERVLSCLPEAEFLVSAPGRVNLIGEHVDYNAGIVLPVAIDRRVWISVKPLTEKRLCICTLDLDDEVEIDLKNLDSKEDMSGNPLPFWSYYPTAVAWAFQMHHLPLKGLKACIASNLSMQAGLSSSAALEVAFALAFQNIAGLSMERMQLAQLCQLAECGFVGVQCGLMDQFAVSHGVARYALYFDTRSLAWQPIPLPPETSLVIADSGKKRTLANSAYNQRRQECQQAVELLTEIDASIQSLRDVDINTFKKYQEQLPKKVAMRALHVIKEIDRVKQSVLFLEDDDAKSFGQTMFESHRSLRDLYEVSCQELDFLVETAAELPSCWGAKLTGAGFGGCTVNLVKRDQAEQFCDQLQNAYFARFGVALKTYQCQADRGAYVEIIR